MGIPPTPENQALVDLLKPVPRNKKQAHINPAKQNIRKQLTQGQMVTLTTPERKTPLAAVELRREPRRRSTPQLVEAQNVAPFISAY
jgi:hypothetical protein